MQVSVEVNGATHLVDVEDRCTLAELLRDHLRLTGTNLGCESGVCGSCTVVVNGEAVRSCLMLAAQCHGVSVRTVEGLADGDRLHPLQTAFAAEHGLQCGFCTPGFLMLVVAALEHNPDLDRDPERLDELLGANLCRCTGYVGIRRAVQAAAAAVRTSVAEEIGAR